MHVVIFSGILPYSLKNFHLFMALVLPVDHYKAVFVLLMNE